VEVLKSADTSVSFTQNQPKKVTAEGIELMSYQVAKLSQYRVVHSLLILAFLLHLRLCSLAVRGLQCVQQSDGSVVLAVDPTVACWEGEHLLLASACGVWAVFVISTPIIAMVLLTCGPAAFCCCCADPEGGETQSEEMHEARRLQTYGFLFRDLRYESSSFSVVGLLVNIVSVTANWVTDDPILKMLLVWICFVLIFG
jgi:hypothetical protein